MEIKTTKKQVISYSNGGAYSDAFKYYVVYGKIYNDDKTRYRPFKYCMRIWKEDLFEYDEYPEYMSIKRQNEIANDLLYSFIDCNYPKDYNNCKNFFDACRESIEQYNATI